jgi:1,4-dihydroxy-2-naphthoyl-CoA hydrolase
LLFSASILFAKLVGLTFMRPEKASVSATVTVGAIGAFPNLPEGSKGTMTTESKANLIAAAPMGTVPAATAEPVSVGRRLQVWQTRIETTEGNPVTLTTQAQLEL